MKTKDINKKSIFKPSAFTILLGGLAITSLIQSVVYFFDATAIKYALDILSAGVGIIVGIYLLDRFLYEKQMVLLHIALSICFILNISYLYGRNNSISFLESVLMYGYLYSIYYAGILLGLIIKFLYNKKMFVRVIGN